MSNIRVYLDNCCYFRRFDDLSNAVSKAEADAVLFIQSLITYGGLDLVYSYMSINEIIDCKFESNKRQILAYLNNSASIYIGKDRRNDIKELVNEIAETGIKYKDAVHIACAMLANCDYFISTDKRLLKYKCKTMKLQNPLDFISEWRRMV